MNELKEWKTQDTQRNLWNGFILVGGPWDALKRWTQEVEEATEQRGRNLQEIIKDENF